MSAHVSDLGVVRNWVRNAVGDAIERRLYPVGDTRREFGGPLVNGLVGDADGVGSSGYGSAEKFNGL